MPREIFLQIKRTDGATYGRWHRVGKNHNFPLRPFLSCSFCLFMNANGWWKGRLSTTTIASPTHKAEDCTPMLLLLPLPLCCCCCCCRCRYPWLCCCYCCCCLFHISFRTYFFLDLDLILWNLSLWTPVTESNQGIYHVFVEAHAHDFPRAHSY